MAKTTAESKLLQLIEETNAKEKAANPPVADVSPDASKLLDSVSSVGVSTVALPSFAQKLLAIFPRDAQSAAGVGLRSFNMALILVILVVGTYFVMDFLKNLKDSQQAVSFAVEQKEFDPFDQSFFAVNDVMDYVATVSKRNIFRPFEKKVEEAKIIAPVENQQIRDKVTNLKIVGISWLSTPETATTMIEDKATQVTHFLKTGDDLEKIKPDLRGLKIDVIYADRVEFSFQGEKLTLSL